MEETPCLSPLPIPILKTWSSSPLSLSSEYAGRLQVCKMNVDESSKVPAMFGIRAIPTLILFKDGEVVDQITGAVAKSTLTAMIEKAL